MQKSGKRLETPQRSLQEVIFVQLTELDICFFFISNSLLPSWLRGYCLTISSSREPQVFPKLVLEESSQLSLTLYGSYSTKFQPTTTLCPQGREDAPRTPAASSSGHHLHPAGVVTRLRNCKKVAPKLSDVVISIFLESMLPCDHHSWDCSYLLSVL